jgi:hypothetical protein
MVSLRRGDRFVKRCSGGEVTEHPGHQRSSRQVIGRFLGVPTRAVRLVGSRVQQPCVDVHRYPLPSRCNTTTADLLVNSP